MCMKNSYLLHNFHSLFISMLLYMVLVHFAIDLYIVGYTILFVSMVFFLVIHTLFIEIILHYVLSFSINWFS